VEIVRDLERENIAPAIAMAASSAVVCFSPNMNLSGVDVGRLLYGLIPAVPENVALDLRPAFLGLKSRLIQVRQVHRTEFVNEAGFTISDNMTIGIIPMGIADGLADLTCDEALVCGQRVPVIGMFFEHARLDLSEVPEAKAGEEVVIIGQQEGAEITLDEVAEYRSELASGLASRVRESITKVYLGKSERAQHDQALLDHDF
jgi:alanine racemase